MKWGVIIQQTHKIDNDMFSGEEGSLRGCFDYGSPARRYA